ncbi:hypothetical protein BJV74DRAFT_795951 [Russula compacta]|nr:hypothetical protein BJV74DRAFT_795951 [Russula compacta]
MLNLWAASVIEYDGDAPWKDSAELYATIDAIQDGDCPWKWMTETYKLCTWDSQQVLHHQLSNAEFKDKFNVAPYRQDLIAEDESTHGAMFVLVIIGSGKTTVSAATGHQEYHPVYMSPSNLTNMAWQAHGNGLLPVAFLPIPKTSKKHQKKAEYQKFCHQIYHACLAYIFKPLKAGMTKPEIVKCPDGLVGRHCARLVSKDPGTLWSDFGICADIVPFTHGFPQADIHKLLTPDLLHQVIKGTFKDHIVMWVNQYFLKVHRDACTNEIIANIDHQYCSLRQVVFQQFLLFWDFDDFQMAMISPSGLEMILKLS